MITLALVASLIAGADTLSSTTVGSVKLKAPTQWVAADADGEKTWATVDEAAKMAISVFAVDPVRPARSCVQQMVDALGTEGFTTLTYGAQPAARKITTDYLGDKDTEKTEANKVTTTTIVGCNGRTKWLLTFSAKTSAAPRFGPVLKRIVDSIQYSK